MGAWGTGINSNDTASDVVDTCKQIYPIVSSEEANRMLLEEYREILSYDEDDDELADFWYALANWQWDHGVLPEENKAIVLNMLDKQYGMTPWIEAGNKTDIRKRKTVLDKLRSKLISQQPPVKIPRVRIEKPKHRTGDIIVFKTIDMEKNDDRYSWIISEYSSSEYFSKDDYHIPERPLSSYNARGKYLAILCVGKEQEPYSKHFPNLFHEHSVYAFYDYCHEEKPRIDVLKKCGFLPTIYYSYSDFNARIVGTLGWTYTFVTADLFLPTKSLVAYFERMHAIDEPQRFSSLFSQKEYLSETEGYFSLDGVFENFFEEKLRFSDIGIEIDNLLKPTVQNPRLLTPAAYNKKKNK